VKQYFISGLLLFFILIGGSAAFRQYVGYLGYNIPIIDKACQTLSSGSCGSLEKNEYSKIKGIPLPVFGLAYFFVTLLTVPFAFRKVERNTLWTFFHLFWTSGGWLVALIFFGIAWLKLRVFCAFCLIQDLAITAIMVLNGMRAWPDRHPIRKLLWRPWEALGYSAAGYLLFRVALGLLVAAPLPWLYYRYLFVPKNLVTPVNVQAIYTSAISGGKRISISGIPGLVHMTDATAGAIPMAVFIDFQCLYCLKHLANLLPLPVSWPDSLDVFLLQFPLNQACNSGLSVNLHPEACAFARLVLAANQTGRARTLICLRIAFPALTYPEFIRLSRETIGPEMDLIVSESGKPEIDQILKKQVDFGRSLNLTGTPKLFIDGYPVPLLHFKDDMMQLVRFFYGEHSKS
jgi:uncharacterized membrane protein